MKRAACNFSSLLPWLACPLVVACATISPLATPPDERQPAHFGYRANGWVWVRGPWNSISPSKDVDDVIDQLCPAVMALPAATFEQYGQEYCGAIYLFNGNYYASHPSNLGNTVRILSEKRKQCKPPRYVEDARGEATTIGDYHSHPWKYSPMSREDRQASRQLWSIRIQFDTGCRIMKLVPHVNEGSRPGEVYAREGRTWKLVGLINPEDKEDGIITPINN